MSKNKLAFLIALLTVSSSVWALEEVSEEELSNLSAQDGVSVVIGLPTNGWRANELSLTDENGIDAGVMAGYSSPGTVVAKNIGFNTCSDGVSAICTPIAGRSIQLFTNAVGDTNGAAVGGSPMLNISFSLINGANKLRFYIDDIRLRNGQSGSTEKVLVDFLQNYVDIVPIGASPLIAMQLGGETVGGHMLHFTNGNFGTIDFGTIAVLDGTTSTNSLRFGLRLDEVNLTGAGFDVNANGLVFSDTNFGKGAMDVTISDVRMGGASAASIGSFGVNNISVSNLTITLAGKN